MAAPLIKTIPIKHCNFEAKVKTAGNGPPLVYLHPAGGPLWDDFVEGLTEHYTVYAPHHPGTGETVRESIYSVDSLWDLVLIYDEIFEALNLHSVPVVGTSFGGIWSKSDEHWSPPASHVQPAPRLARPSYSMVRMGRRRRPGACDGPRSGKMGAGP